PSFVYVLGNDASLRFLPIFTYTSELYNDALNTPQLRRPAIQDLSASLHYTAPDDRYDFAVGGTNLIDKRFYMAGAVNYGAGVGQGYISPPRQWYATVRVSMK